MPNTMKISDQLTVSGQPTVGDLAQLAKDGFKTVVNLRTDNEPEQPLSPADEGKRVVELGMSYRHIPVSPSGIRPTDVDAFRAIVDTLAKPAFIHCHSGMRAGALVMMDNAIKAQWSGEQTLQKAWDMGFECKVPAMKAFVKDYVDGHQR